MMHKFLATTLIASAATLLSACTPSINQANLSADENPFGQETFNWKDAYLSKQNFTIDVIRFEDRRRPRTIAPKASDDIIYEYKPDTLVGGVTHRIPVLFSKYFGFGTTKPNTLLAEIDLQKLKTFIRTGTLTTGSFGRYIVELEADVTVRDTDSSVLNTQTYTQSLELKRYSFNGRSPSAEMDRSRMYQIVEEAVRRMAEDIAKDAKPTFHKALAKRKKLAREQEKAEKRAQKAAQQQ